MSQTIPCAECGRPGLLFPSGDFDCPHCRAATIDEQRAAIRSNMADAKARRAARAEAANYVREEAGK